MKRLLSILLVVCLVLTMALAGCGNTTGKGTGTDSTSSGGQTSTGGDSTGGGGTRVISHDKEITIDNYNVAANYHGEQTGWFGKLLKDKFNIKLNILAPQVAGDALYQTRISSGNLGDIVILEGPDFADCVQNGLIKDISDEIKNWPNLMEYYHQIETYNKSIPGNEQGKIYGIPCQMTNTSPTAYSQDVIYSSPQLRWDLYQAIGAPVIQDLDGLLDALAEIQKIHPTNEDGEPAYAMTLWPDWDGGDNMMGIANVVQLTTWYGEKIKGSVVLRPDGTFYKLTDKNGTYRKMLKFLFDAQQRGLVDPDSMDQDWNAVYPKIASGRVHLLWYSWQGGFWNTAERLADGTAFIFIPVMDQNYYADSDTYYGSGRVFGIGSGVDDEKFLRIMEFLDWYASPDGLEYQHIGIEGFNYTRGADGKLTIKNENALMDNLPVPEEWGGGGFNDGNNAINQWIVDAISTNPKTGEPYSRTYWSTYKAATQTEMKRQWAEKFGANEPAEWMKKNGKLTSEFFSVPQVETMDEFRKMATEMFAEDADEFLALCDAQSGNIEEVRKKASVSGLEYSIRIAAQANDQSKTGVPIYYYNFDAEIPGWDNPGTFHSVDLWFTFETLAKCWRPFTGKHYDLARQICNYWCNFIRSGDPNGKDSTGEEMERWEPYTTDAPYCMVFGDTPKFVREQPGDLMKFLVDQYFKRRF